MSEDGLDEEPWRCAECGAPEPPIFLCSEGWWCEPCYRKVGGVPNEVSSERLHDAINDNDALGYTESLRRNLYGEVED